MEKPSKLFAMQSGTADGAFAIVMPTDGGAPSLIENEALSGWHLATARENASFVNGGLSPFAQPAVQISAATQRHFANVIII